MIYGVGTDLCDTTRIRAALLRHGERFAAKVLTEAEMNTWRARTSRCPERGVSFVASRFAAKEAFAKAIGLGMQAPMTWRNCEVAQQPSGQPFIVLHGPLHAWCQARHLHAHISLSDERHFALAHCVAETRPPIDRPPATP